MAFATMSAGYGPRFSALTLELGRRLVKRCFPSVSELQGRIDHPFSLRLVVLAMQQF
jgi:hypothetical protein